MAPPEDFEISFGFRKPSKDDTIVFYCRVLSVAPFLIANAYELTLSRRVGSALPTLLL